MADVLTKQIDRSEVLVGGISYQNLRSIGGNRKRREGRESDFALPLSKKVHLLREQTPQNNTKTLSVAIVFTHMSPSPTQNKFMINDTCQAWILVIIRK